MMTTHWSDKLALIVITLWVGGLWAIGYLAAPSLFMSLDDKPLAGSLAGRMFTLMSYVGMVSAAYLILHGLLGHGLRVMRTATFWIVVLMLALVLIGHFGVQPIIASLKAQAWPADVMHSMFADRFRTWHGVASIAYLLQSLLGLWLVLRSR